MSSNLVIVAIPDETDRVWKVSSEKVPHLTILHLGDSEQVSNLEQIIEFVEHAASTSLCRFYLPVDRRGELGDAKADVLFFKKNRYDFKAVRDFRSLLLKDSNIKTAYDSTAQFEAPEHVGKPGHPWIPHLTLGYPETPAKPIPDEYGTIYSVDFNKLAVWTGDYDGPDWMLKDYWDEMESMDNIAMDAPLSVAMSGVKGMKWGVRKVDVGKGGHILVNERNDVARVSNASTTAIVAPALVMPLLTPLAFLSPRVRAEVMASHAYNKGTKADNKWKKQIDKSKKGVEVHNTAANEINKKIVDFNNDARWKGVDLTKNPAKQKEYDDAATKELINPEYAKAAVTVYGSKSPSGRHTFEIKDASAGLLKMTRVDEVEHAAEDQMEIRFKINRDENGHILGFEPDDDDVVRHTANLGAEFILEHYGVKGMHWGQRRAAPSAVSPRATSRVPHGRARKTKIEVEGGENHNAHEDAIKVAEARAKLSRSGPAALSNKELQTVANRIELEDRVARVTQSKGRRFVSKQLGQTRDQTAQFLINREIKKKL